MCSAGRARRSRSPRPASVAGEVHHAMRTIALARKAWKIDRYHDYQKVRRDIAAVKVAMPTVLHDVVMRAMQVHGALGVPDEMPFVKMLVAAQSLAIADRPTRSAATKSPTAPPWSMARREWMLRRLIVSG